MKYLPIINLLSLVLGCYWLINDMPWFIKLKADAIEFLLLLYNFLYKSWTNKIKVLSKDFLCNISCSGNKEIEKY